MGEAKTHPQTMTFAVIAFLNETAATEVVSIEHSSWVAAPLSFSVPLPWLSSLYLFAI